MTCSCGVPIAAGETCIWCHHTAPAWPYDGARAVSADGVFGPDPVTLRQVGPDRWQAERPRAGYVWRSRVGDTRWALWRWAPMTAEGG